MQILKSFSFFRTHLALPLDSHSFRFVTVCELSKFGSLDLVTPSQTWDAHAFVLSAIFRWIPFGPWLDSYITLTKRVMPWMMGYSRQVRETQSDPPTQIVTNFVDAPFCYNSPHLQFITRCAMSLCIPGVTQCKNDQITKNDAHSIFKLFKCHCFQFQRIQVKTLKIVNTFFDNNFIAIKYL